jgi:hypothetical protein
MKEGRVKFRVRRARLLFTPYKGVDGSSLLKCLECLK